MKRLTIAGVILSVLVTVCIARYRPRASTLKPKKTQLAEPSLTGPISFEQALALRRSVRDFTSQPLNLEQIGQLAWAGQGITDRQTGFRTAPSAGALYPINLYFATQKGLFIYHPDEHSLEKISDQDVRNRLATAALQQEAVAQAACDIIVTGSSRKLAAKYGNKAGRFMLLEAGHIAQNILLQAVSLQLGSVSVGAFDIRAVSRLCKLPTNLEPLYIICVGYPYPAEQTAAQTSKQENQTHQMDTTKPKRAVLIIASANFRDEELFQTKSELEKANIETVIASTKTGVIRGMLRGRAEAEILVSKLNVDDYDAIIFVGGSGAKEYFNNSVALNIARQARDKQKVLAAICIAPAVLANAGLLDGLRATSFSSERIKLQRAGAQYTGSDVERDGLIITASGPEAATQFGKTIVEALESR